MKFISKFDRYVSAIFIFTILAIIATSYFTLKEFFSIHSERQQAAVVPLYALITDEIVRPLTIGQFMAYDKFLVDHIEKETIDKNLITNYMRALSEKFGLLTFIAIEKHNLMVDSNDKTTSLSNEKAEWFHRLKNINKSQFADIGNVDNPHLYFDVKLLNEKKEFLGFTGVAVDLDKFAQSFAKFNKRFGFELFFVDEDGIITLSSNDLMKTESHHRRNELTHINTLPWYNYYLQQNNKDLSCADCIDDEAKTDAENEYIITQLPLQALNWQIFIVASEASKQREYWQLFANKLLILVLVSFILFFIFTFTVNYFKSALVKSSETDDLTQLPNRSFINWQYSQMRKKYNNICVVIADIDNFKTVNDTFGHLVGDDVLKIVADELSDNLRTDDLVGRWGGEEFIMLLPDTSITTAEDVINRIRTNIEVITFNAEHAEKQFNITVSFGLSDSQLKGVELNDIIKKTDEALYEAKANGRNQVVVYTH